MKLQWPPEEKQIFIAQNVLENINGEKVAWAMLESSWANPNNPENIPLGIANMNIAHSELSKVKDQMEYENVQHGSAIYACVPQHLQMH
jgi:hypothetical protein